MTSHSEIKTKLGIFGAEDEAPRNIGINFPPECIKKKSQTKFGIFGAEDEARTRDNQLGRLELYQLSYFRMI